MGRAKLRLELITKERKKIASFKKRKGGLVKMMKQLTTLCDVPACMIIYGPDREAGCETWPENKEEVRGMIHSYKTRNGGKTFGLVDFFQERKRKIEDELSSLRKKKWELQVSTWMESLDVLTLEELRKLSGNLTLKCETMKCRIEFIKGRKERLGIMTTSMDSQSQEISIHSSENMIQRGLGFVQEVSSINSNHGQHVPSTGDGRTLGWFDGPLMAPLPYMMNLPHEYVSVARSPPLPYVPWLEIDDLDRITCDLGGEYKEHSVMVPQVAPPQLPEPALSQFPFLWQENNDDSTYVWGNGNHWGLCFE